MWNLSCFLILQRELNSFPEIMHDRRMANANIAEQKEQDLYSSILQSQVAWIDEWINQLIDHP